MTLFLSLLILVWAAGFIVALSLTRRGRVRVARWWKQRHWG